MTGRWLWMVLLAASVGPVLPVGGAVLVNNDFAQDAGGWSLIPTARLATAADSPGTQVLQLTRSGTYQVGVAWTELRARVPSFSFFADIRVVYSPRPGACPADGFTLVFAPVETDYAGDWGGSLGLCNNPLLIRQFVALEVNTWHGQGLGTEEERQGCGSGKHETFAFDVLRPNQPRTEAARTKGGGTPETGGFKIGQINPPSGMRIVNGGWYRYQWNVEADGRMAVFVTGLDPQNQEFQKVNVLETKLPTNPLDLFDGRWGLTAATGGAVQTVEVARATIESPVVPPR